MNLEALQKSVQSSVLIALGFSAFCSGFYLWNLLHLGQGSWQVLFDGVANIAGPTAIFALVVNLFVRLPEKSKTS